MMSQPRSRSRSQAGITLMELLVSMIILAVVSTMLVMVWMNLQRASATTITTNQARATARDALGRIASELRDAQPQTLPTASPTPTYVPAMFTEAQKYSATFLSLYNQPGAGSDVTGAAGRRLTRIWLDTTNKTLYWQRDTNDSDTIDAGDRTNVLARDIVNPSFDDGNAGTPYTAIFLYGCRDSSNVLQWTDHRDSAADRMAIVAVRVRLIVDANLNRTPAAVDVTTTVLPRNAVAY